MMFNTFSISRFGEGGEELEEVWTLKPDRNIPIRELRYGVVPDGWREILPARPLREGSWYSVNAHNYFRLTPTATGISAEVKSLTEFLREASTRTKR